MCDSGLVLDFTLIHTDRKRINITVERDRRIVVRAPKSCSEERVQALLQRKKLWLFEKLRSGQKFPDEYNEKEFVSGETLLYLGRHYPLRVSKRDVNGIRFDREFVISHLHQSKAPMLLKQWYVKRAKEKLAPRVASFARTLGVAYNAIRVSEMEYRWGSCTPKKNLVFNWKLIKAPLFVIDYIIVHELAHLIEPNHSDDFWNIVAAQVPKYQKAKEWLKQNGSVLESSL